jgi:hypothetical protein
VKLVLALVPFTALIVFTLFVALQFAGDPVGDDEEIPILLAVSLFFGLIIAGLQIGALGIIRLLPWQGPSLDVRHGDHLRRIFE